MIALVLGSAECVEDDARAALALFDPDCVIAVNDMIARWPDAIDHAVTLHVEHLPAWLRARRRIQPDRPMVWSNLNSRSLGRLAANVDRTLEDWKGSSGLLGVQVALELGMRAVIAGIPLDSRPHVAGFSSTTWYGLPWPEHQIEPYRAAWRTNLRTISSRVRSMSGWTQSLLGKPDEAWVRRDP